MRMSRSLLVAALVAISTGYCPGVWAQNPYDTDGAIQAPKKTTTTTTSRTGVPATALGSTITDVQKNNGYSTAQYAGYLVSHPIVQATIIFTDETKGYERISWFQQIVSEHGCKMIKLDKKEVVTGNIFNRKKTMTATAQIEGRGFVVKAIKGYYGGTLTGNPDAITANGDATLKDIVGLETQNQATELSILNYSFEIDRLIVERSKMGALDFSGKSRVDKALKDLRESKIPAAKAKLQANHDTIGRLFNDQVSKAMTAKDYGRAIDMIKASRNGSENSKYQLGNCHMGLGQYDQAIGYYKGLTGSGSYGEKAELGLAGAYHAKGDDREALNAIYRTLGNFRNSPEELAALARIDDWKLLSKSAQYPELPEQISKVYVQKGLLNNQANHSTAVSDYKRAAEIKANGGSAAEASKTILGEYAAVKSQYASQLAQSKTAAETRFMMERERAKGSYDAWQRSHNSAVTKAKDDYYYEVQSKRRDLEEARRELDYLNRNPPKPATGGSSTDPYSGSTKPTTGGSSTDPYSSGSTKPSSGTDPYSGKRTGGTDPYAGGSTGGSTGTDPYAGGNSGSTTGTDPYASEYQTRLANARAKVTRLESQYNWLYYNETSYVDDKTSSERASLNAAKREYEKYDLSKKASYVAADSEVQKYAQLTASADQRFGTLKGLAKEAGY